MTQGTTDQHCLLGGDGADGPAIRLGTPGAIWKCCVLRGVGGGMRKFPGSSSRYSEHNGVGGDDGRGATL